jgi:hypothetical protein
MNVLRVKEGVLFTVIAPGGFVILSALEMLCQEINHDITITSACDGTHSGPEDPHHRGEAYDIRTHDLPDKGFALEELKQILNQDEFFMWIEDADGENEHIHIQVKKGTTYP